MMTVPPLTPYLVVSDCAAAVEFYKKAFAAEQDGDAHTMPGTDKIMHVRLIVNGAMIMLADDFAFMRGMASETPQALCGSPVTLALQVADADSFWQRAVDAGAKVTMPLANMFWGDRYGQFLDPFGHKWSISQTVNLMSDDEMQSAAEETMEKHGTLIAEPD